MIEPHSWLKKLALIALFSLSLVFALGKSYENSLRGIDSNIHARVSLDVTSTGFYPRLPIPNGNGSDSSTVDSKSSKSVYFNDHPFFFFWLNGWMMRALGPSAWSARVLTGIFSAGSVVLTVLLGMSWHSALCGFLAGLILLLTRDFILTGATVSLDPPMLFFILLSFYFWSKRRWWGVGLAAGIGLWIKTPVVLLVFPTAFLISAFKGNLKKESLPLFSSLFLALILGSLVWIVTGTIGGVALVQDYFSRQLFGTALGGRNLGLQIDWFMFFRMVRNGFIPGLPLLIVFGIQFIRKKLWKSPLVSGSLAAIFVMIAAITPMKFKMDYYYNPVFPFLALLSAAGLVSLIRIGIKKWEAGLYFGFVGISLLGMAAVICFPISFGPEPFPALKTFIPFVQTYGKPNDRILVVAGGEPLGSSHDYQLVLNFYTRKSVSVCECSEVQGELNRLNPQWIIISKSNFENCLNFASKALFPSRIDLRGQVLLSTRVIDFDLTPLLGEFAPEKESSYLNR